MSQDFSGSNIHTGNGGSGIVGGRGGDFSSHNMLNTGAGVMINTMNHNYPPPAPPAAVTSSNPGYHIPSKPNIFVGRDEVVQETVSQILQRKHVALIGTGGVGKSSIAKAIMHNERAMEYFTSYRCFVTYSDVETSMMSRGVFLQHLADALSMPTATTLPTILSKLRTSSTLLVIDNAETFLSAKTKDVEQIKLVIAELGGCESVHLILTTRSANLPNLHWLRQVIGGLDVEASRELFRATYDKDIGNRLDSLFASLDHHALSISLLSHVATQREYHTTSEIEEAWKRQQTHMLETGEGKSESLPATIELSLNSPSLRAREATVLAFLRTIAFLPEGIHCGDLPGIFANFTDIEDVISAVSLSSLTYRSGERFTMLAPIRLYIMNHYNPNLTYKDSILVAIRNYSYKKLLSDHEFWGVRESANTERLLSFDLSSVHVQHDYKARLRILKSVKDLCDTLYYYHPREISLFPLLKSVSEHRPILHARGMAIGRRQSQQLILAKAQCLEDICWLQYRLSRDFIKNDMLGTAESFCRSHLPTCTEQLVSCLRLKGTQYQVNGNLFLADEALREASTLAHSLNDPLHVATLNHSLSRILFLQGNISESTSLMASAEEYLRSNNQHTHLVYLLQDQVDVLVYEKDFETAREVLGEVEELDREHNGGRRSRNLLNWKASVEGWAGNVAAAMKVLDEATRDEMRPGMLKFDQYVEAWRAKASYAATGGKFDDAYEFLAQAVDLASQTGHFSRIDQLLEGYIGLYSGEWDKAKELLETVLEEDDKEDIQLTGFIHRALGEVALLNGDKDEAMIRFKRVESLCSTSGMAPKFLYANQPHFHDLSADYDGWIRFLDGTL